ncbi:uncharacterized protein LOC130015366 [Mercurialis annua]|uniref:uncharacterized protein LOC130015366 n=1 Tax=Mercurialis annua TaxID=3986 RepID=UPI0024AE6214|nr:uncharacterized protein LOC130015366 [Mercurialis annua]
MAWNQNYMQYRNFQYNCEICGDFGHTRADCHVLYPDWNGHANYMGDQWQASETYGWNDTWENFNENLNFNSSYHPHQNEWDFNSNFDNEPQQSPDFLQNWNVDEGSKIDEFIEEMRTGFQNQAAVNHRLETQISQLAILIQNIAQDGLPSTTESNLKEQVKIIELRSGKSLDSPYVTKVVQVDDVPINSDDEMAETPYVNALVGHHPTKVHVDAEKEQCEDGELETPIFHPITTSMSLNNESGEQFGITVLYKEFNKTFDFKDPFLEGFDSEYDGNNTKYMLHTPHVPYYRVQAYSISSEFYLKEPTRKKRKKMLPRRLPHVRLYF